MMRASSRPKSLGWPLQQMGLRSPCQHDGWYERVRYSPVRQLDASCGVLLIMAPCASYHGAACRVRADATTMHVVELGLHALDAHHTICAHYMQAEGGQLSVAGVIKSTHERSVSTASEKCKGPVP